MERLNKWFGVLLIMVLILMAGCGGTNPEKVKKKVMEKWTEQDGYEIKAQMSVQSANENAQYDIDVWHTKPDYYRVSVSEEDPEKTQLIVRNKEGVFVISPHLQKSYQFKSDWPLKHSQAYLIESLARDIQDDAEAEFSEQDKTYTFVTKTKTTHQQQLPKQTIVIDKKSLLPKQVIIHTEDGQEKMELTFTKIELGKIHSAGDYGVDPFEKAKEGTASAELDDPEFQTTYPMATIEGVELVDEQVMNQDEGKRVILNYAGAKSFTIIQQPSNSTALLPVFAQGDPLPIELPLAAANEYSLQWEDNGIQYFLASTTLTQEEMLEVAASMQAPSLK